MDDTYLTSWKPGGALIGVSGRQTSRVFISGNNSLVRWNWKEVRGKKGRLIQVIFAYRVLQDSPAQAGETTGYKQQVRSLMLRG